MVSALMAVSVSVHPQFQLLKKAVINFFRLFLQVLATWGQLWSLTPVNTGVSTVMPGCQLICILAYKCVCL